MSSLGQSLKSASVTDLKFRLSENLIIKEFNKVKQIVGSEKIRLLTPPPKNFNPLEASDRDLKRYGFPQRPDHLKMPEAAARWVRAFRQLSLYEHVIPEFEVTKKFHGTNRRSNVGSAGIVNATADNWSGSVLFIGGSDKFTGISGNWIIPHVYATPKSKHTETCSVWLGIDGDGSPDVAQAGTETESNGKCYAWVEWFPDSEIKVKKFDVKPGDVISLVLCVNTTTAATIYIAIAGLDKEIQKTFLKTINLSYRNLAEILIEQNRLAEAQQVLDLLKDQQFFDFNRTLNEPVKQLVQTSREVEFATRYDKSSAQIGKIGQQIEELKKSLGTRQPTMEESAQLQKFESELKIATKGFIGVLKEFETEFSKSADDKDKIGNVPDTTTMQTALRNLSQQTGQKNVAVYTLVGEDNFRALIVSADGIKAVSSPIKGTELNDKAKQLWGLLQSDKYDTTVLSKQIYDVIFAPIEKELPKDTTTITWSLDGNLRYIPMAALWDGKQFLAERFNHVNFTRADAERMLRNLNPNWTGTGFGTTQPQVVDLFNNGDKINFSALPGVSEELKEIFKQPNTNFGILTGEVLPDAKFTKDNFLESMKQHRPVVHIASHFSFRPGDEARSFLLLGDGTAFTLNDMKKETNLFQGVDLLTLSACNTAATQTDANGREVDGFAELAQRLGAGAVMATLWSVSDASTPWLMRDFYATKLSNAKMTKAEALRKAQLELLNGTAQTKPLPNNEKGTDEDKVQIKITPDGKRDSTTATRAEIVYVAEKDALLFRKDDKKPFAHPYYWSPFVLIGNWK